MSSNLPYWAKHYVLHMLDHRPELYDALNASGELEAAALQVNELAKHHYSSMIRQYCYRGYSSTDLEVRINREIMRRYVFLGPGERDVGLSGIVPEVPHWQEAGEPAPPPSVLNR